MPRPIDRKRSRRPARRIASFLTIGAVLLAVATGTMAASPGASASPKAAPKASPTFESMCAPVPAPLARCNSMRRTDIAAVPAPTGAAADAIGAPLVVSGYGPSDLRSAYGLPSSGGAGRTIAIVDAYDLPSAAADLAIYRAQFGLPACTVASGCFRKVDQRGGTSYPGSGAANGWAGEIELDMDMVSAVCPDCKILLVEADTPDLTDLGAAVDTAVGLGAVAVSNSYGAGEWSLEGQQDVNYNHAGVAIVASTGDSGYAAGVEYPAASPYVISVGGTTLQTAANARGWTETVWGPTPSFGTGSGCSLFEPKPYWQTDSGCSHKTTADVSAVADPATGVAVYDSTFHGWAVYGGTSAASPIVTAALALTGRPAPSSYPSRALYDRTASLWDVVSGSNGTCGNYLCQAAVGYDGPTGLGTPHGTAALAPDVLDLGAGSRTSCALTGDGVISCWGYDGHGEASAPAGTYIALSTGDSHSCAIDAARAIHCWGLNSSGESSPPAGSYVSVSAGGADSCAIDTAGLLHCWGAAGSGITSVPSGSYRAVSVGDFHACAIALAGTLTCWGDDSKGQATPPGGTFVAVAAGQYHTCALASAGTTRCWGDNTLGQLNRPVGSYLEMDAGSNGACALALTGVVHCWGDNTSGQNSPTGATASRVALGDTHGCAYLASSIACWGGNADGQSVPLFNPASLSVAVPNLPYASAVTLSSAVVPAPTFTITSGSPPSGIALSPDGQLSGAASTPGTYHFSVTASNGIAPAATQALTLVVDATPAPGAPTAVVAIASDTTAVVTWAAPIPNGGAGITGYTVISSPSATGCSMTMVLSCSFSGLTNRHKYTFSVTATNPDGTGPAASASATPLFGATYLPITPNRLVDSRPSAHFGLAASLRSGVPAEFVVVERTANAATRVPSGAIAVTGNLTVTNQGSSGFLALTPANPGSVPGTSTLNFPKGDNRANAVTISLSPTGSLWVTYVGAAGTSADVVFDVTGYFVDNSSGSTHVSLTPNRLVDSRAGTRLGLGSSIRSGTSAWFTVVGRNPSNSLLNVPVDATAVTGNLTVTNQGSKGYLALTPVQPSGTPGTSTLNFPKGDNRANAVTVPLVDGRLWVTFVGTAGTSADVIFDVTGYFIGDTSGATYVALTPSRIVDSRPGTALGLASSLATGVPAQFTVTGLSPDANLNVPVGAVAITGNLTVTRQTSVGYLALTPADPGGVFSTSTLNFPTGDNRANAVVTALSPAGTLWVTFVGRSGATTDVIFDVTGYFAP